MALPKEFVKKQRVRLLASNSVVTGFGNEYESLNSNDAIPRPGLGAGSSVVEGSVKKCTTKLHPAEWWFDEAGLFNLDEEGQAEKQQCDVAASNILRNFSFMAENEVIMIQDHHCLETVFQCIEDHVTVISQVILPAAHHLQLLQGCSKSYRNKQCRRIIMLLTWRGL